MRKRGDEESRRGMVPGAVTKNIINAISPSVRGGGWITQNWVLYIFIKLEDGFESFWIFLVPLSEEFF
jgi:hypothetical protein